LKPPALLFPSLLGGVLLAWASCVSGQSLLPSGSLAVMEGEPPTATPDSNQYADGMRAIREARWSDAENAFDHVVKGQGRHAEGALYWKAYAQAKKGQSKTALDTCGELRHSYPASSWMEECSALEIEIRAKNNLPLRPSGAQSDEVKLLALNSLINKNETRALEQIAAILNGDSSERLKQGALFILGEHHYNVTYPQIVRLSYVEGDVRIARGLQNQHPGEAAWEKAAAGLPLETGFTLATGAGKAEIETESASTISLAENSVLTLNDLHTTVGVPYTEVALLTGTVSFDIEPFMANEVFLLKTPTDNLVSRYPDKARFRVDSYLDAIALTPLTDGLLRTPGVPKQQLAKGKTLYYLDGQRIEYDRAKDSATLADWDRWVADRTAGRSAAVAEVMKASGLTEPIPGLAGLQGKGTFFDCAPYGTCWEPNGADVVEADTQRSQAHPSTGRSSDATAYVASRVSSAPLHDPYFPCAPEPALAPASRDALTGKKVATTAISWQDELSYSWAVCHAGGWIYHHNHYVWVAGQRRHHHPPYQWIKSGKTVAFVPLHPHDVKGHIPVNRKVEVFVLKDENGKSFERAQLNPNGPVELLKAPPKDFRETRFPTLARADEPHLMAHQLRDVLVGKNTMARAGGVPISFDQRSQSFLMTRQVMEGHKSATVIAPMNNHGGNLQTHAANYSGGSRSFGTMNGGNVGTRAGTAVTSSSISKSATTVASAPSTNSGTTAAPASTGTVTNGPSGAGSHR